jgi:hypothetical protein
MSEEEVKKKQMRVNEDKIRMTPEDELAIYLLFKQGQTAKIIQEKVLRPDGTQWSESKIKKLLTRFRSGKAPSTDGDQSEKAFNTLMGISLESDLKDFDAQKSMSRSFKMATRLMEKALEDAQNGYVIVDEQARRIPIKTLMECIEKAGRYWSLELKTRKEGGANGTFKIDYKEMAKIFMGAKAEGIPYNAKGHMKAVIDAAHQQKSDDSKTPEFEENLEQDDEA